MRWGLLSCVRAGAGGSFHVVTSGTCEKKEE
jgi:hypothetical protein